MIVEPLSYQPTAPVTVARAALAAFNAQNCAAIYGLTAPWVRGSLPRAATIAACARGFADDRAQGIQSLRLTLDGHGRYVSTGVYRQPLLAQEATQGSTRTVHETMQLVHMRGQWYVLATW